MVLLGKEALDQRLDVEVVAGRRLAANQPPCSQVLQEDGRRGGDELQEMFPVLAAHDAVSEAGEVARAAVEEAPMSAPLPVSVVCRVGAEHEQEAEGAAEHKMGSRGRDHALQKGLHCFRPDDVGNVHKDRKNGVRDEMGFDPSKREGAGKF